MAVSKLPNGKWLCQCFPNGRTGIRIRKRFATKGEALAYERQQMFKSEDDDFGVDDSNATKLSDLINRWYDMHGKTLNSGNGRKSKLDSICDRLGDPLVSDFDRNMFAQYCSGILNLAT